MRSSGTVNASPERIRGMAIAAALLLCGLLVTPVGALARPFRTADVTVSADRDSLFVGERLRYRITVRHDGRGKLAVTGLQAGSGRSFELVRREDASVRLPDGGVELQVTAELAAFGTGRQQLPGFTVTRARSGRSPAAALPYRPGASVVVVHLTDSTMARLRPAAPPVGAGFLPWLLLSGVALSLLLLAFAVRFILRMTLFGDARGAFFDPVRSARQKLRSLDRQLSRGLAPSEVYEALSNILREFLQHRFRFRAMEQVTQEIAEELERREVKSRETVLRLLLRADYIKFADGRPDLEECRRSLKDAEAFCSETTGQAGTAAQAPDEEPPAVSGGTTR